VLGIFKPFEPAGTDGIVPVLLQQEMEHLVPSLCRIFRAYMAYGFVPMAWRQVRMIFIPKPRKLDIPRLRLIVLSACHLSF
jgi:hypothetical protein